MIDFMTPENAALLIGAFAALLYAITKGISLISAAASTFITSRADVRRIEADNKRLIAEAEARSVDAESERESKIITILDRLTEQNNRWPTIAEDFATAQNRQVEVQEAFRRTNEAVAAALHENATENKALRISLEPLPKVFDTTLAETIETLNRLEKQIDGFDASHVFLREIVTEIRQNVTEIKRHAHDILDILTNPDRRPPTLVEPPKTAAPLNADGAATKATLDDLPQASGQ